MTTASSPLITPCHFRSQKDKREHTDTFKGNHNQRNRIDCGICFILNHIHLQKNDEEIFVLTILSSRFVMKIAWWRHRQDCLIQTGASHNLLLIWIQTTCTPLRLFGPCLLEDDCDYCVSKVEIFRRTQILHQTIDKRDKATFVLAKASNIWETRFNPKYEAWMHKSV